MKILFQGDSITDAYRDQSNPHHLGVGYCLYAARLLQEAYPDKEFEFINLGISGHQTKDLVDRLQSDFVDVQPDVVSILVGINEVLHHAGARDWVPGEVFEERYRTILTTIREKTNARIMIMEPFLIPVEDKLYFREDLDPKIQIVRKLAREFADVYLPTDGLLASAYIGNDPVAFAADGIHPTALGAELIGRWYADYVAPLIRELG